ncbi:MAG: TRAP transporter substrate-binding protein DctP [Deltaproteobacteria bacterium]|nr:TRAP transporter substrate-binding protein DctP [Deltaproteobacteria bacterium]
MTRRLLVHCLLLLTLTVGLPTAAFAGDSVTVKWATLAPEGTTWFKALRQIGDKWQEISGGKVQVKIYAGGVVGNETAMVRKMRIGQLHGGQITNIGLVDFDPGPQAIQAPMLVRTNEELDYVMANMGGTFEERLLEKGLVVLNWGDAGWVHLFTSDAMTDPGQTGNFKIYAYDGDPEAVKLFEKFGFNPVVMTATDVLPSLQSGLINAFPSTRLGALSLQWFALSKNMLDVPWAPLMGATVISKDVWEQIPAEYHADFKKAAKDIGDATRGEIRKQDVKAVAVMKKFGLTVNSVDAATRAKWEAIGEDAAELWGSKVVPPEVFAEVKRLVAEHRAKNP